MEAVLQTLAQATSQNPAELKPAEQRLSAWESELPGFYSFLWVRLLAFYALIFNVYF